MKTLYLRLGKTESNYERRTWKNPDYIFQDVPSNK